MTTSIRKTMPNQSMNEMTIKTNQKNSMHVKINRQEKKKTTTGDNIDMKSDSLAAVAVHPETDDDVDREAKEVKVAPSTEVAQFFPLHPSAVTSTRTLNVFDITAYAS